ncbi:MAG: threonine synthase, partial [Clostridia bacterium]
GYNNYLELWHGPTCAFKDMALQLLPRLLVTSMDINKTDKQIVILVATSGDTGKAALEGFKNINKTKIIVYYPQDGVSPMQKRQMQTQEGDAQTGVKNIFTNKEIAKKLNNNGFEFSSANSINWGRLVPQIVYYFSSYVDMIKTGEIKIGEKINFCVPTGNFGNILAGYYAKLMGLPVNKFICASNSNNVLTDFINTG